MNGRLTLPGTKSSCTVAEAFGHASFALVALSYSFEDPLLLRSLAVTGSSCMLFFTYYHPHGKPLWLPLRWNLIFIGVNLWQIEGLLEERYRATLMSKEDSRVHKNYLSEFDKTDWAKLVRIGERGKLDTKEVLFYQGVMNDTVSLIVDGELECLVDGERTYVLKPGNFVAEAGLHAGASVKGDVKTSGTVKATKPTTIIKFNRAELCNLLEANASLRKSLQSRLSWDIVSKLKLQRHALENGGIKADAKKWTQKRNVQTEQRYEALLSAFIKNGTISPRDRQVIEKYRSIHVIEEGVHLRALKGLGWTGNQYKLGHQENETSIKRRTEIERKNSDLSL